MYNFNKPLVIALIVTAVIALPVILLNTQYTASVVIFVAFVASMISATAAIIRPRKGSSRQRPAEHRVPYNQSRRESGSVKWFNASKGFGFITRDSGDDIFVHFRSIRGEGHRVLHDGQRVEFAISEGDKGLQAEDVAAAK